MWSYVTTTSNELYHHGIKGQRWGVRRFQNEDGSLTPAGEKRYNDGSGQNKSAAQPKPANQQPPKPDIKKDQMNSEQKQDKAKAASKEAEKKAAKEAKEANKNDRVQRQIDKMYAKQDIKEYKKSQRTKRLLIVGAAVVGIVVGKKIYDHFNGSNSAPAALNVPAIAPPPSNAGASGAKKAFSNAANSTKQSFANMFKSAKKSTKSSAKASKVFTPDDILDSVKKAAGSTKTKRPLEDIILDAKDFTVKDFTSNRSSASQLFLSNPKPPILLLPAPK